MCVYTYVLYSLRVDMIEARSSISRLSAECETRRRGYQHDKQLENLRALQVLAIPCQSLSLVIIIITLFIPFTQCSENKTKEYKTLGMTKDNKARGSLTVDQYTTRHSSVTTIYDATSMRRSFDGRSTQYVTHQCPLTR